MKFFLEIYDFKKLSREFKDPEFTADQLKIKWLHLIIESLELQEK
jgi:hypothetical protein